MRDREKGRERARGGKAEDRNIYLFTQRGRGEKRNKGTKSVDLEQTAKDLRMDFQQIHPVVQEA